MAVPLCDSIPKAREGGGLGWDTGRLLCEADAERHRLIREAESGTPQNSISTASPLYRAQMTVPHTSNEHAES